MSQNIQQVTPFEDPDQITIGNGQGLNINALDVSSFHSPFNLKFPPTLKNLLFVPSVTKNLLSVSWFCKDNSAFFEFHPSFCVIKSQVSKEVLLQGLVGHDRLYHFPDLLQSSRQYSSSSVSVQSSSSSINRQNNVSLVNVASTCNDSYAIWNSRLGYPSAEVLKLVLKLCNISLINKTSSDFCSSCCVGKFHRLPSSPSLS